MKQLKEMSPKQLHHLAGELRYQIQAKSFQALSGELKTTHELRQHRRTLARVMTLLRQQEKAGVAGGAPNA